jgi:hypothetical protein
MCRSLFLIIGKGTYKWKENGAICHNPIHLSSSSFIDYQRILTGVK